MVTAVTRGWTVRRAVERIRWWALRRWPWAVPLLVFLLVKKEFARVHTLLEAILGIGFVILVARRPYRAISFLLVLLPFNTVILSALYRYHVPGSLVRGLGFYKEGVIAGLAVAAVRAHRARRRPFDAADRLAVAFVVLGLLYLVAGHLFVGNAVGGDLSFYGRELGWRGDVLYVGVFLIARRLELDRDQLEALLQRVLLVVFLVAVIGIYEFTRPYSFNHFITVTLQLGRYQAQVLHAPLADPTNILAFANGTSHVRIGSVLINNLLDGWYYVLGLSLAVERVTRSRRATFAWICIPVIGAALVFTQARASIIAGGIAVALSLTRQSGRLSSLRVHLGSLITMGLLIAVPVVVITGLGHRFVGSGQSNQGHVTKVSEGLGIMESHPLGQGLGTGVAGGQSAVGKGVVSSSAVFDPEDQWLEIGLQLGFLGLAIYVAALVLMIRRMRPRGPDPSSALAPSGPGVRTALIGILVGGFVAQPFIEPVVSWTVFALCGLVAGNADLLAEREFREIGDPHGRPPTPGDREVSLSFMISVPVRAHGT